MPVYMTEVTVSAHAWAELLKNPEDRSVVVANALEQLGGRLIKAYAYLSGEWHGNTIYEVPDAATAEAFVLAITAAGHHPTTKTTELLNMDDLNTAYKKAAQLDFRGPGA